MCDKEEEWSLKVCGILLVKGQLAFKTVPRIIESINFIYPERFSIKGVKPQGEADKEAENENEDLFLFSLIHSRGVNIH